MNTVWHAPKLRALPTAPHPENKCTPGFYDPTWFIITESDGFVKGAYESSRENGGLRLHPFQLLQAVIADTLAVEKHHIIGALAENA